MHKKLRMAAIEQDCTATEIIERLLNQELDWGGSDFMKNFYSNAYNGKVKAWKVFVFGYVLFLLPFSILFGMLQFNQTAIYFLLVARLIYSCWLIVSLWKCSVNTSHIFFNLLTKAMAFFVVIDCVNTIPILLKWPTQYLRIWPVGSSIVLRPRADSRWKNSLNLNSQLPSYETLTRHHHAVPRLFRSARWVDIIQHLRHQPYDLVHRQLDFQANRRTDQNMGSHRPHRSPRLEWHKVCIFKRA